MKRGLTLSLAAVLALLLSVCLAIGAVLGTSAGSRWVLGQVPGLEIDGFEGRLGGSWSAASLRWQRGVQWLQATQPQLQWSPACLLRLRLCIGRLQAERIDMDFPGDASPAVPGPVELPALQLPLAVELGEVTLGSLRYAGTEVASDLHVSATATAQGITFSQLAARRGDISVALHGQLIPVAGWPLQADGAVQLPPVQGQPWQLGLHIKGDVQGELALSGSSSGYLNGQLQGALQPLGEHLPAHLSITSEHFMASTSLPPTLALDAVALNAQGNLQTGYHIDGRATLPAQQGPVAVRLRGNVTASGASVEALQLDAGGGQQVGLAGELNWQGALAAKLQLNWQAFPWQRLYPQAEQPPVAVQALQAEVDYRDGHYLGNLNGQFQGPAGPFSLVTPLSGDLENLYLPQLQLTAGQGQASGELRLGFANGVRWKTRLDLARLDPAYWVAQLPGRLGGSLVSDGQWQAGELAANAQLDIKGQLRGQPAVVQLQASGQGKHWAVPLLDLRLGANQVKGRASIADKLDAQLTLALPKLAQLWPGLQGQAKGNIDVAGTVQAPAGEASLNASSLALQGTQVQALALQATLGAQQRGQLQLTASGLRQGDTVLGTLTARAEGDQGRQSLALKLDGPTLFTDLGFDGTWAKGDWRGRLARGEVRAGGQAWQLQAPARLERLASGQVNLGAHCWRAGAASLCGEDQRLAPEPRLRYHLKQFALAGLAPWLPADFAWNGLLNADISLDLPASGPAGTLMVDAGNGTLRVRNEGQWVSLPYRTLRLDTQFAPRRVDSRLVFDGEQLGQLQLQAQLDPLAPGKPLVGQFQLSGLDLAVARPFMPAVETFSGRLAGSGQLAGSLETPQVHGQVRLSGGEVAGAGLPITVHGLELLALLDGQQARLDGQWHSGTQGLAKISGQLGWARGLAVDVNLNGQHLPVTVEPYARLDVAPDLHLGLENGELAVSGQVNIPDGAITVRQLPPSTVKVSDDTVIVGQAPAGSTAAAMKMDVNVDVGQGKLTFDGFGLQADLAGHVHVGNNLDTRGELVLGNGRYRAYGQRLTLRRARVFFAGPIGQPYLDIEAVRVTDDVTAGIRLSGSVEQPQSEVFSEPAMSQEQALSYLVLGRPLSTTGEDNNMLAQAALGLGLMGTSGKAGELASSLGIQDFQLDTEGSGNKTNVVASGNLSEKLTLRYGVGVFEPANTIALRYALTKQLYVEVAGGLASSLDLFYKKDF